MANIAAPQGFIAVRKLDGGAVSNSRPYAIASAYATDIFIGDPVKLNTTTNVIEKAAAGEALLGVFAGCFYETADGMHIEWGHWPAGTTVTKVEAMVYNDPDLIFRVQADSAAVAAVGKLCDIIVGTGNARTRRSGSSVEASAAAIAAAQVRILGLSQFPAPQDDGLNGMNDYGANAWVDVMIVEHQLRPLAAKLFEIKEINQWP